MTHVVAAMRNFALPVPQVALSSFPIFSRWWLGGNYCRGSAILLRGTVQEDLTSSCFQAVICLLNVTLWYV